MHTVQHGRLVDVVASGWSDLAKAVRSLFNLPGVLGYHGAAWDKAHRAKNSGKPLVSSQSQCSSFLDKKTSRSRMRLDFDRIALSENIPG